MKFESKVIALIPARSGSKGIKDKNIQEIQSKSLLERAINSADIDEIDEIYVSTDSELYANLAIKYGAKIHIRNKEEADDFASSERVIKSFINFIERENNKEFTLLLLEPTSPFRNKHHVSSALNLFNKFGGKLPLVSCCLASRRPYNLVISENQNLIKRDNYLKKFDFKRRQENLKLWRINSAIYIFNSKFEGENFLANTTLIKYRMSDLDSFNIDTEDELICAKALAKEYNI